MIGIVDYGMGNLSSVSKAVQFLGFDTVISNKKEELINCKGLILPGVGAFADAMKNLNNLNLVSIIKAFIKTGKPFLGICLGLQLLFESSEEGAGIGLCLLDGKVKKLPLELELKIPHMGWNYLNINNNNNVFIDIKKSHMFILYTRIMWMRTIKKM